MRNKHQLVKRLPLYLDDLSTAKEYLEKMAREGWMLVGMKGFRYVFEMCEPREINFAVEIFDQASMFDTFESDENLEYIEYCEKAGWNFICANGKIQFFYTEDLDLVPIETDDELKFKAILKSMKMENIWTMYLLPLMSIFYIVNPLSLYKYDRLTSFVSFSIFVLFSSLLVMSIVRLVCFHLWKNRCKKSIAEGKGLVHRKHPNPKIINMAGLGIMLVWSFLGYIAWCKSGDRVNLIIFFSSTITLLGIGISMITAMIMRKKKVKPGINLFAQVTIPCIFILGLIVFEIFAIININDQAQEKEQVLITMSTLGYKQNNHHEFSVTYNNFGKFLLELESYFELGQGKGDEAPVMLYYLYRTKWNPIYDLVEQNVKMGILPEKYSVVESGFLEVTQIINSNEMEVYFYEKPGEEMGYRYVFFYDHMILDLYTNFILDDIQIKNIGEKLEGESPMVLI